MADEESRLWQPGDVHNGYVFTKEGNWLPLLGSAPAAMRPPRQDTRRSRFAARYRRRLIGCVIGTALFYAVLPALNGNLNGVPWGVVDVLSSVLIGLFIVGPLVTLIAAALPDRVFDWLFKTSR